MKQEAAAGAPGCRQPKLPNVTSPDPTRYMVTLDAATHIYRDAEGREFVSVTRLLGIDAPFDSAAVAERVVTDSRSKYFRWLVSDVLKHWDNTAVAGTALHAAIEHWIKTGQLPPSMDSRFAAVSFFAAGKWNGRLHAESVTWDATLRLAGTIDITNEKATHDVLWDIKTSRRVPPEKHLKFSMQLEIYRRMRAQLTGRKVIAGGTIWFPNFIDSPNTKPQILKPLPCDSEVNSLLSRWRASLDTAALNT